jgi:hypothetical protein
MSKFKNIPGLVWLVIGVLVTLLVIPSTAYAAALKFTGIEGTSTNKADVTPAGQLLTTEAQPSNLLGGSSEGRGDFLGSAAGPTTVVFTAPSNEAVVMDSLWLDVVYWTTSAGADTAYALYVGNSTCTTSVGDWAITVNPTGFGTTEVPLTPGVAVPAGDALCAGADAPSGTFEIAATATGSLVPSTDVSNGPLHAVPVLNPPNG